MRVRVLAGLLALLLLLAGCQAEENNTAPEPEPVKIPAEDSPAHPAETVTVHWDTLEERTPAVSTAKRLSDGPLEDFIPGDYGVVVPYIGGEQRVCEGYWEAGGKPAYTTQYLYGFCTTDGTILTDPVYQDIYRLEWYNESSGRSQILPVWVASRTMRDESREDYGGWYTARGLLAADGSWYTGLRFEDGLLAACDSRLLIAESRESAVLLSIEDGSEICRYSPYDFLPPEYQDNVSWLFTDGGPGSFTGLEGGCFRFEYNIWTEEEGDLNFTCWIDGEVGKIVDYLPYVPSFYEDWTGRNQFPGGWYYYDDAEDDHEFTLYYDDGTEKTISFPEEYGSVSEVGESYLVFYRWDEEVETNTYTLTDHELNVFHQSSGDAACLFRDSVTGESWPGCTREEGQGMGLYVLLDGQGQELFSSTAYPYLYNGYLAAVDEDAYRLLDLNGGGIQEVFRIPRWDALDIPVS